MHVTTLVLEAPLMSFGRVAVDEKRSTTTLPYKSLVVGLITNAMGLRRTDPDRLQAIDDAIEIVSRLDRRGKIITDYQTAYLGTGNPARDERPSFVEPTMWSSLGYVQGRTFDGTLPTEREYLSDACVTVCVGTDDEKLGAEIAQACRRPARPLFVGRKACLVSRPVFESETTHDRLFDGLMTAPVQDEDTRSASGSRVLEVQWPAHLPSPVNQYREERITDLRNWVTGQHVGSRKVRRGMCSFHQGEIA